MTLFFYGTVELKQDKAEAIRLLLELGQRLSWNLDIEEILQRHSFNSLFNLPSSRQTDFLTFEVDSSNDIYDDYDAYALREQHYRKIAHNLSFPNWESIEFGSDQAVDVAYNTNPPDFSVIRFLKGLFELFPVSQIVVCLDQGYDNHYNCREIVGDESELLREAWLTVAFGYSWPNLRLKLIPL